MQGRGFQTIPDIAGLSIFRSYGVLQPQRTARPRGDRSFSLARTSTVEIYVNGQIVRRVRLDPGTYNLRDFPFTQGANDVAVRVEDDAGTRETLRFNVFFDRSQLEKGLSEYGLYAGVKASLEAAGPNYSDDWAVSGFYRRGFSETLTLGVNAQADSRLKMAGVEALWGSPIGTLGLNLSASDMDRYGSGAALQATLQRLFPTPGAESRALNLYFETRTKDFATLDQIQPDNRYSFEAGAAYTQAISERVYAALDARYSKARGNNGDVGTYRATVGYRLTPDIGVKLDAVYEDRPGRRDASALLTVTARLGGWSSVRAEYDTRDDRARLAYQAIHGQGVGSWNVNADAIRTPDDSGLSGGFNYTANRAELGVSHYSSFDGAFHRATDQRTSLRIGTALAFADGAFSIGRPVYDAFAIIVPHESLKGASVVVNPTTYGYTAESGRLGTALETNIASYAERTATVDAPGAPTGYDLGKGSFHLFAPYRGGYRLQVGSDYSVTAIGRLLNAQSQPIALVAGKAFEVGEEDREPVLVFTNREGRFGAMGLRPGRWRIEMPTEPAMQFILEIPTKTTGAVRVGDLTPSVPEK